MRKFVVFGAFILTLVATDWSSRNAHAQNPFTTFAGSDPYLQKLLNSVIMPAGVRPLANKIAANNGKAPNAEDPVLGYGKRIQNDPNEVARGLEMAFNTELFGGRATPADEVDVLRGRLTLKAREERAVILERTKGPLRQSFFQTYSPLIYDCDAMIVAIDNEIAMLRGEMPNTTTKKEPANLDASIPHTAVHDSEQSTLEADITAALVDSILTPPEPPTPADVLNELQYLTSLPSKQQAALHQHLGSELSSLGSAYHQKYITTAAYEELSQEILNQQKLLSTANDIVIANEKGIVPAAIQPDDLIFGAMAVKDLIAAANAIKAAVELAKAEAKLGAEVATTLAGIPANAVKDSIKWTAVNGPGPLGEKVAGTFRRGTYVESVLAQDITIYRVYGGAAGELRNYWTYVPPAGPFQSKIDGALAWGNSAEHIVAVKVPAGTTIYEGVTAPQKVRWPTAHGPGAGQGDEYEPLGVFLGGGSQIYLPTVDPTWIIR